jgi:hypothetical protein
MTAFEQTAALRAALGVGLFSAMASHGGSLIWLIDDALDFMA